MSYVGYTGVANQAQTTPGCAIDSYARAFGVASWPSMRMVACVVWPLMLPKL